MRDYIAKGNAVLLRTNNGGEIIATLVKDYHATYCATVSIHGADVVILAQRLTYIEPLPALDAHVTAYNWQQQFSDWKRAARR